MRRPHLARLVAGLLTLVATGCHAPLAGGGRAETRFDRAEWQVIDGIDVPAVQGIEGCGAQALAAVLAYRDPALDAVTLGAELPWHDVGATPVDLLLAARERGFTAEITHGSWDVLAADVAAARPVLVMIDAAPEVRTLTAGIPTSPVMHWAVVSGMAADGSAVLVAAEGARHHVVDRSAFERRWSASANCRIAVDRPSTPAAPAERAAD